MGLRQRITILILLAVAGAALVTASLYLGLPASGRVARIVFLEIRLPRLLVGAAAGAGLGVAGLLVQRAMRNPLAVPDLLGVSGGAAFVAALLVTSGIHSLTARTAGALAGAVAGGALCLLAAARGRSAAQTLLIGAAVSTAWQAAVLTVMSTADQVELSIIFKYLVGSLTEITADAALPLIVPLVIGCAATVAVLPALGVLSLGDEQASALGMNPGRWRLLALGVAALLVALVVAACGPIAWVAFVAPTVTRWFVPGAGEVFRLAVTAIIGAGVSVGADIAARELFKPFETPLGAWTALIGFCVAMVFVAGEAGPVSRRAWLGLWIAAAALIVPAAHLALGRGVDWSELLAGTDMVSWRVLTELRLPRLVVALFAGTALGLAGLALQSVLRNPLAAPELTAVNPSAVLGYLIASGTGLIDGGSVFSSVLSATVGGLLGGGLLWLVAHRRTSEQTAVLGLLSALALTGVVTILIAARPTGVGGALRWLIGSVEARVAEHVPMIAIPVLAGFAALVLVADRLEILAVSDSHAHCLGVSPGFWRGVGIGIAVLLASAAVATVGPLAFVGFVAPHVVRLVFGGRLRRQVVLVAVCGGLFVAVSDLIAKAVSLAIQLTGDGQQVGVPVGAVTCLIGAAALVAVASSHQESEP